MVPALVRGGGGPAAIVVTVAIWKRGTLVRSLVPQTGFISALEHGCASKIPFWISRQWVWYDMWLALSFPSVRSRWMIISFPKWNWTLFKASWTRLKQKWSFSNWSERLSDKNWHFIRELKWFFVQKGWKIFSLKIFKYTCTKKGHSL